MKCKDDTYIKLVETRDINPYIRGALKVHGSKREIYNQTEGPRQSRKKYQQSEHGKQKDKQWQEDNKDYRNERKWAKRREN